MDGLLRKTAVSAIGAAVAYLVLFWLCDRAVAVWFHTTWSGTWLSQAGTYISYLADGPSIRFAIAIGFVVILVGDNGLHHRWARTLLYICLSAAIAMVIADGLKVFLGRYRPVMLFEHNLYGLHFFSSEWAMNSTPSGHTVRAFSLLTAASLLYRRMTIVFFSIAVLIGASRVVVTAHYPSDVLFGAFIGIVTAVWVHKHFFQIKTGNQR